MTIHFTCAICASALKIKDALAGASAHCPKCKSTFVVPEPDSINETLRINQDISLDSAVSNGSIPSPMNVAEHLSSREAASENPAPSDASMNQFESVLDSSTATNVGQDTFDRNSSTPMQRDWLQGDTAQISSTVTVVELEIDDLDSPPMMLLTLLSTAKSIPVAPAVEHVPKYRVTMERAGNLTETPVFSRSQPSVPVISPLAPPANDPPVERFLSLAQDKSEFSIEPPGVPATLNDRATPTRKMHAPNQDLSPSGESENGSRVPTQRPQSRPTPTPQPNRSTSEKVDLATAAKMMKKAIKESQSAEAHQREIDSRSGFDFSQIFREFGLKGLAVIVGGGLMTYGIYLAADRMFGNPLRLPPMGYVHGVITLDGKPLQGATIYFAPTETEMAGTKKERIRTSVGTANERGEFRMMYIPSDRIEGVAVGTSRVWVIHVGDKGKSVIPLEWSEAARQTKEVTPGHKNPPLELKLVSKAR